MKPRVEVLSIVCPKGQRRQPNPASRYQDRSRALPRSNTKNNDSASFRLLWKQRIEWLCASRPGSLNSPRLRCWLPMLLSLFM